MPAVAVLGAACGESSSTAGVTTTSTVGATTTSSSGAATTGAWASGGTSLISVAYPDSSAFNPDSACQVSLNEATTEGPCYFQSDTGEDISTGLTGLPMQLCLQLIDTECQPLSDHVIEVWHCDTDGVYSGDTSQSADADRFAGDFCTGGDGEAEQATWYRGQLTTDSDGRVNFKSCFPGWYSGRTLHIHFAVSDAEGTGRVISQFCFPDTFAEDICTTHELYSDRGVQDTPLAGGTDTVFPADSFENFMLATQQNSDGTLLAYGTIQMDPTVIAASTGGDVGGGAGGPGGDVGGGAGGPGGEPPEQG